MSTRRPVVAVIIVTYNGSRWVEKCFSSFRLSSYPVTVYAVDNNSSDDTVVRIKEFPEVVLTASATNAGFGQANNLAIKKALADGADYCFLLNQDAWIEPNTIQNLIHAFEHSAGYGIISPVHLNGSGSNPDFAFRGYVSKQYNVEEVLSSHSDVPKDIEFINAAAWMVSKDCLQQVGGFGHIFPHYGEDRDVVQRLHYYRLKLGFITSARIFHDRPDKRFDFSDAKRMEWYYAVGSRVRLADINQSAASSFISVLFWLMKDTIALTFSGKLSAPKVFFSVFFNILIRSHAAIKAYRKEIASGKRFLFLS